MAVRFIRQVFEEELHALYDVRQARQEGKLACKQAGRLAKTLEILCVEVRIFPWVLSLAEHELVSDEVVPNISPEIIAFFEGLEELISISSCPPK